jgi:adenine specific DNA methylase Mod
MRDIKFRAYAKADKTWHYWDVYGEYPQGIYGELSEPQQYIGLKDNNGVEIYEGDRIIFDNKDIGGQRHEGIVEWNSDQLLDNLCWGLWVPKKGWLHCDFLGSLEVVGNVFEGG